MNKLFLALSICVACGNALAEDAWRFSAGLDYDHVKQKRSVENTYGTASISVLAQSIPLTGDHPHAEAAFVGRVASVGLRYSLGRYQNLGYAVADEADYKSRAVDVTLMHPETNFYAQLIWRHAEVERYTWSEPVSGFVGSTGEDHLVRSLRLGYFIGQNLLLSAAYAETRNRDDSDYEDEHKSVARSSQLSMRYLTVRENGRGYALEGSILRRNPTPDYGAGSEIALNGTYYLSAAQGLALGVTRSNDNTTNGRGVEFSAKYEVFITPRVSLHASYRNFRPAGDTDLEDKHWWGLGVNGRF